MAKHSPRKPRIVPALGRLGIAEIPSHFPHIQAVMEFGGQIDLAYKGSAAGALAFGKKGFIAGVRAYPDKSVEFQLRRLDWAIAIAQSTRTPVDEVIGGSRIVPIEAAEKIVLRLQIPDISALLQRGGSISFGHKKFGAVAAEGSKPLAILAPIPGQGVEALLRRVNWAIALVRASGQTIDEVFMPPAPAAGQTPPPVGRPNSPT